MLGFILFIVGVALLVYAGALYLKAKPASKAAALVAKAEADLAPVETELKQL